MRHNQDVIQKIQLLPDALLQQVDDFIDFLLLRYEKQEDDLPTEAITQLNAASASFAWLHDPAEDIYSDDDGEPV